MLSGYYLLRRVSRDGRRYISAMQAEDSSLQTITSMAKTTEKNKPSVKGQSHTSPTGDQHPKMWYIIRGFSRFASRFDLELVLGEHKPDQVEPLLVSELLLPTGKYGILMTDPEKAESLRRYLNKKFSNQKYTLSPEPYPLSDSKMVLAINKGITRSTVRLSSIDKRMNPAGLLNWLDGFTLRKENPVELFLRKKDRELYLIHCTSPEEAQRLVASRMNALLCSRYLNLLHYHA